MRTGGFWLPCSPKVGSSRPNRTSVPVARSQRLLAARDGGAGQRSWIGGDLRRGSAEEVAAIRRLAALVVHTLGDGERGYKCRARRGSAQSESCKERSSGSLARQAASGGSYTACGYQICVATILISRQRPELGPENPLRVCRWRSTIRFRMPSSPICRCHRY